MNILKRTLTAVAALFLSASVYGQTTTCNTATIPLCSPTEGGADIKIKPQAVPTSTTVVTTYDAYLKGFTVNNPTAGALIFTIADRQGSPIEAIGPVSIAAGTAYIIVWPEGRLYWCPGGFTILASGAGLRIQGSFRQ